MPSACVHVLQAPTLLLSALLIRKKVRLYAGSGVVPTHIACEKLRLIRCGCQRRLRRSKHLREHHSCAASVINTAWVMHALGLHLHWANAGAVESPGTRGSGCIRRSSRLDVLDEASSRTRIEDNRECAARACPTSLAERCSWEACRSLRALVGTNAVSLLLLEAGDCGVLQPSSASSLRAEPVPRGPGAGRHRAMARRP